MVKRFILFIVILLVAVLLIKRTNMTWKQSLLKTFYPLIMYASKLMGKEKAMAFNTNKTKPLQSFYALNAVKNNGDTLDFNELKGKKIMIVNTASDCGYTGQFTELEKLYQQYGSQLVILGFPANDFREQEKKSDQAIAEFCKLNYGVTFQLMKKTSVIKSAAQNPVFEWLSNNRANGWCNLAPEWNFCKFMVDEQGILQAYFTQSISPLDEQVIKLVE